MLVSTMRHTIIPLKVIRPPINDTGLRIANHG